MYYTHLYIMTTISVPLNSDLLSTLTSMSQSIGASKASIMRKALQRLDEELVINNILAREHEPSLSGDLRELIKQID